MTTIEKLTYIWNQSGLSQEAIADELKVSFVTVNRWLHYRMRPRYQNRIKISKLYNVCQINRIRSKIEQKIYFAL